MVSNNIEGNGDNVVFKLVIKTQVSIYIVCTIVDPVVQEDIVVTYSDHMASPSELRLYKTQYFQCYIIYIYIYIYIYK